jgi:hypothetical protein
VAEEEYRRFYPRAAFVALTGNIPLALLQAKAAELNATLSQPIIDLRETPGESGAIFEWRARPSDADLLAVDGFVAAFVGGTTTSEPFEIESLGITQATSATLVDKIDVTTPPLEPGTYQMVWCTTLRMNPAGAASGVLGTVRLTRSDGVFREQKDSWDLTAEHAFNGAITFKVTAGQTLNAKVSVSRIGANGVAEMLGVRVTIDQLSAG